MLSLSQKELGPDSASLPCRDAATLTPLRSGGVSGEAHTFSAESKEREAKAGRGVHAQGLPNPPSSLGSSQSKDGAETAGVLANGTSSGETEGGLGTPSRHGMVRAQGRRGGFVPSPTTAPPQPGPCLRMTTSSWSRLQASVSLGATSYGQPTSLFLSPAMLLHSDPHTWVLTSSLSSVNTGAEYFHPTEASLPYQSHITTSRVQYARVCSVPPCTMLNVALGRAALPSRLPLQPAPQTGSLPPGRPSAPDTLSKALPCLCIPVVCFPR